MEATPGAKRLTGSAPSRRPFGFITDQHGAVAIARRMTLSGHQIVAHLTGAARNADGIARGDLASVAADVSIACDVIAIAIDDTLAMRHVLFGSEDRPGIALDLRPGAVLIDFGIRTPRESQGILGVLGMRGVGVVDAAIIGGPEAIARGAATVLAGGFPDALEGALPLLSELGTIERTGPLGSAQTAAALMGYVEAAQLTARSEALSFGRSLGLRAEALAHILEAAPADEKIKRLTRSAEIVRGLAQEQGCSGDIIDLTRRRAAPAGSETG